MFSANDNDIDPQDHSTFQHPARLHRPRILIVEDEALVAMLAEDVLRDAGAEIVGVSGTVLEALHLIEQVTSDGGLDGAVLDINLDGQPVTPVADRLAILGVPFLFATGYNKNYGMGAYAGVPVLRKPFASANLVAAVGALTTPRPARATSFGAKAKGTWYTSNPPA